MAGWHVLVLAVTETRPCFVRTEIMWEIETRLTSLDQSEARTEAGQPIRGRGQALGQGWTPALPLPSLARLMMMMILRTRYSRTELSVSPLWSVCVPIQRKREKDEMYFGNRHDYPCFVKLADKTGCFMQIADNILIFLLTTRSMLLSHCHCQAAPGTSEASVNQNKIQIKLLTKLWRWSIAIQVILNLNKPILLLLAHGFYIRNTFGNWM